MHGARNMRRQYKGENEDEPPCRIGSTPCWFQYDLWKPRVGSLFFKDVC